MTESDEAPQTCRFRRHQHLARPRQALDAIYRIEEGWTCRYTMLGGARRQITALYLPGEYCEPQWLLDRHCAQSVLALTSVRATLLPLPVQRFAAQAVRQLEPLAAAIVQSINRQAEWIASLGRKSAPERICALLLDLYERCTRVAGHARGHCAMPLTQVDLADITGLTPIHVNRVLRDLRERGIVTIESRRMEIGNPALMREMASGRS